MHGLCLDRLAIVRPTRRRSPAHHRPSRKALGRWMTASEAQSSSYMHRPVSSLMLKPAQELHICTHQAAMAFRAKTPPVLRPTARRTIERARSIATARPSRRSPSRVLWLSRTKSRAIACPWRAHCQPGLSHADVDAEQDGRGSASDGPSALAAEVSLARRGHRAMALGACSSEGRRVEDGHTPSVQCALGSRAVCHGPRRLHASLTGRPMRM